MKAALLQGYEQSLKRYLQSASNPKKYRRMVEHFINWTEVSQYTTIAYPQMLEYIRYSQQAGRKPALINRYLRAIRLFFDYLNENQSSYLNPITNYNPAKDLQIKGVHNKINPHYLQQRELESLYEHYNGKHKILLGLYVYQGLKTGEIEQLEAIHFDLQKGTVYIPKTLRGNPRKLLLASTQLYALSLHINQLQGNSLLGTKLQGKTMQVCKELRVINPKVMNARQLRGSRISYWVRKYDIRQAQYLAGHLSVAGTEKYKRVNIENLQNELNKYHPFK